MLLSGSDGDTYVGPIMRFMQFGLNKSSPGILSLNDRLRGVSEPSCGSIDHEKVASLNPTISLFAISKPDIGVSNSVNESMSSVCLKKSSIRSSDTFAKNITDKVNHNASSWKKEN